ncbi:glycosyltransferase family 2 protein [Marinospirillum perlucidum]|uniref:glycosyltransferase family 2 protein n=1 Tax=Marinospirillum perlucidum TaxID=1982602 RepID=UPI000DF30E67|nr:glycosyltransferase family 2 protein [Marinospirillum perlucidum]
MKNISVVVPVYKEERNICSFYERLNTVLSKLNEYSFRVIMVNDGSPDNSMQELRKLCTVDNRVSAIGLSRNFGKEIALSAGVAEAADSDAVICIDADLQHPPELIPELIDKWNDGFDIVATVRRTIDEQPLFRRLGSHFYYWVMRKISGLDMVSQTTDYRLYDKKVINAFLLATERERMFRGIMDWMGYDKVYVEFDAAARESGEAGYSYAKLIKLALNSITSFSLLPLRATAYLGFLITISTSLLLLWMGFSYLLNEEPIYTALAFVVVFNTFLIGIVLSCLGLVAHYIGAIHTEVINRPLYLIKEKINTYK